MFGPKNPETLIFQKTKKWWEMLHKVHLPEERSKLTSSELKSLVVCMQEIEEVVWVIQMELKTPLDEMIDFGKLKKKFFDQYKYKYGEPIEE